MIVGAPSPERSGRKWQRVLLRWFPVFGAILGFAGVALNSGLLWEYFATGRIGERWHWTYPVTGSFLVLSGLQLFTFGIIFRMFEAFEEKEVFLFSLTGRSTPLEKKKSPSVQGAGGIQPQSSAE